MDESGSVVKKLQARVAACTATPAVYRLSLSIAILVVGLAANIFLATRLQEARLRGAEARATLEHYHEVQDLLRQATVYHGSLQEEADLVYWQDVVQGLLQEAGARLSSFTPGQSISTGNFNVLSLEVSATGSFPQLAGFIQRLEHDGGLTRVDEFTMHLEDGVLSLDCKIRILTGTSYLDLNRDEEEAVMP